MILKKDVHEVHDTFLNALADLEDTHNRLALMKNDISQKLTVLNNECEYAFHQLRNIALSANANPNIILLAENKSYGGSYDFYGNTVHPQFIGAPRNILNFISPNGAYYIDGAAVKINGQSHDGFQSVLKHDSLLQKEIAFDEFTEEKLTLEIELDTSNLLSANDVNVIEICPFMAGSFSIESIEIYTLQSVVAKSAAADFVTVMPLRACGPSRILLEKPYKIARIVFHIALQYKNQHGKYPFGLKHIYFYNAAFNKDSYIAAQYTADSYIDFISDDIFIQTLFSKQAATCSEYGIELYENYSAATGVFEHQIYPSNTQAVNIDADLDAFFLKIPLSTSLLSVAFKKISTR